MPYSTRLASYPEEFFNIAQALAARPLQPFSLQLPNKAAAQHMRAKLYGFRKALLNEGLALDNPVMKGINAMFIRIFDTGQMEIWHTDMLPEHKAIAGALATMNLTPHNIAHASRLHQVDSSPLGIVPSPLDQQSEPSAPSALDTAIAAFMSKD